MKPYFLIFPLILMLTSCSCNPEGIAQFAFSSMENVLGDGFMPSEELRALGKFQSTSVNLSASTQDGVEESTIFLRLENGDPKLLAERRELLARQCAELYLRDFEKAAEYAQITIQFVQTDPSDSENMAMEEYSFAVADFNP
jgi:hypothetical protein